MQSLAVCLAFVGCGAYGARIAFSSVPRTLGTQIVVVPSNAKP